MELDQDLLNLWLQAEQGLSTGQARQLIFALQEARNTDDALREEMQDKEFYAETPYPREQWGLDLQTPSASRFQPTVFPPLFAQEG